jgi:ubiquinone/menaquinone biosynthesis C-methylase UbiE
MNANDRIFLIPNYQHFPASCQSRPWRVLERGRTCASTDVSEDQAPFSSPPMKTLLCAALAALLAACATDSEPSGHGHAANAHMQRMDFDKLVARFEDPARAQWQKPERVIAALGPLPGKTVADIGAGTGYFAFPIAKQAGKVIAIDIDERFLRYIDEKKQNRKIAANLETRRTSPDSPGLKRHEADAVLIVDTYHHIEERVKYLKRLRKGLRENGVLVIVDFKKKKTPHGPPLELRLSEKEVEKEMESAGYRVFIDGETLPYQYIIQAR